ncbi:hypothetical protein ACJX0J_022738 [Zea mays]
MHHQLYITCLWLFHLRSGNQTIENMTLQPNIQYEHRTNNLAFDESEETTKQFLPAIDSRFKKTVRERERERFRGVHDMRCQHTGVGTIHRDKNLYNLLFFFFS